MEKPTVAASSVSGSDSHAEAIISYPRDEVTASDEIQQSTSWKNHDSWNRREWRSGRSFGITAGPDELREHGPNRCRLLLCQALPKRPQRGLALMPGDRQQPVLRLAALLSDHGAELHARRHRVGGVPRRIHHSSVCPFHRALRPAARASRRPSTTARRGRRQREPTSAATARAGVAYEVFAPFLQSRGLYEQRDHADPPHPRQHEGRAKCRLRPETRNPPVPRRNRATSERSLPRLSTRLAGNSSVRELCAVGRRRREGDHANP